MNRKKRTVVLWSGAGIGWAAAVSVTFVAPFVDFAREHPFTVNRVFVLVALAAAVLTVMGAITWARRPSIPVSAETAYDLGVEFGKSLGRMEATMWNAPASPFDQIMDTRGQQDTPPVGWRIR